MNDFQLSKHFSYYELTATNNAALQAQNRQEGLGFLPPLEALCQTILEPIRGDRPLRINSGFRCPALNGATKGSSKTSQHPLGQAADISRPGQDPEELFEEVFQLVATQKIPFGQLIYEQAKRDYGVARWVHVSLGRGFRAPERCGEILRMEDVGDGKWRTKLISKIAQ